MVFQMIDGKEREGIMEWVRRHRSLFGIATAQGAGVGGPGPEVVELDPKWHPLLRAATAGAIPNMSRAAVDAAVGLVVDDLSGPGPG